MITRTVTWSHYDHVAMILKFDSDPDEVYLVESTGGTGVALNKWSFLRSHIGVTKKFYKKCVYRHLEFERDGEMMEKLEIFLKNVIGLGYAVRPLDIIRRKTKPRGKDVSDFEDETTFFCSELIAKAYKLLGII